MQPSEQDPPAGRGKAPSPTPEPSASGSPSGMEGPPTVPTLHEFPSELMARPDARSGLEFDPQEALHRAGLGDVSETNLPHAAALTGDVVPVEMVRLRLRAARPACGRLLPAGARSPSAHCTTVSFRIPTNSWS